VRGNCALETASPRGGSTLYEWVCVDVEGPVDMRVRYGSGALSRGGIGRLGVEEGGWHLCVQPAHNNKTWKDKGITMMQVVHGDSMGEQKSYKSYMVTSRFIERAGARAVQSFIHMDAYGSGAF